MLRSTLRVSRNFPSGGNTSTSVLGNMSRHSGTGSVVGTGFADWNGNGTQDPGDAALENIPIRLANLGSANTTRSGEFAFVNVPIGLLQVGIDLTSLPNPRAPARRAASRQGLPVVRRRAAAIRSGRPVPGAGRGIHVARLGAEGRARAGTGTIAEGLGWSGNADREADGQAVDPGTRCAQREHEPAVAHTASRPACGRH